ncbi:Conserved_hypothetical protein [Hexamita inflata]|uniref:C3H1-type domain-containing protein n=1 Tax=Hexamita inflata TaxID=28002 RepID=A0AA86NPD6_9EUKA|nr:Conserved hypothetical protein [Hexamita inflata]CAI9936603.1 Conserved hypothetical protein [Hexamita inflata]
MNLDIFPLSATEEPSSSFDPLIFSSMPMAPPGFENSFSEGDRRIPVSFSQNYFTKLEPLVEEQPKRNYPRSALTIENLDMLCKNYMRGGCDFVGCKFYHPTPTELIVYSKRIQTFYLQKFGPVDICRDFLNNCCDRPQCKYKHPDAYWLGVYQKFNNNEDECGVALARVEQLSIPKKSFKLSDVPK